MNKLLTEKLKSLGLNTSETAVYVYMLEGGAMHVHEISKGSGVLRTNCYSVLKNMIDKGLVEKQEGANKVTYLANNPTRFIRLLEDRKNSFIDELLPELTNLYKSQKNKPIIKFYEGMKQIEEVYIQMYETKDTLYGLTSIKRLIPLQ